MNGFLKVKKELWGLKIVIEYKLNPTGLADSVNTFAEQQTSLAIDQQGSQMISNNVIKLRFHI